MGTTRNALFFGIVSGLSLGLLYGLILGLFAGLRRSILDIKAIPNLGIKLSMRNAFLAGGLGLVFGLLYGLFYALIVPVNLGPLGLLIFGPISGLRVGVLYGIILGLTYGVIAFFWYGAKDVIQHRILRSILYWKRYTPLRYANFLDYAARLVFLQKVGGGYIFIHRLLLEHFAANKER